MLIYLASLSLLSACATPPPASIDLEQALATKVAITIPMSLTEKGLIVLKDVKVNGRSMDFVMDTGATQSAIFEGSLQRLDLDLTALNETLVHGMMESKEHRVVNLAKLEVGPVKFHVKPMVILDDREASFGSTTKYDGLIGMDILAGYQLYISPRLGELRLIPNRTEVFVPSAWQRVEMIENPFLADNRDLHFIELRVDGRKTPAMLDTGSEFSAMNWSSASFAQAKPIRKRLRKEWELQGAVGTFDPTAKVIMDRIRSGQKFWEDRSFVIMDFKSLGVLGVEDEPFIIVGMNFFSEEEFFLDFQRNLLAIKPRRNVPRRILRDR
ncbi:MAG: aspartyl protease family protein [Hellea sp.]